MPATHTYHTLNDYRVVPDVYYESDSHSKWYAGALIIAIFLGASGYFFYSTHQRNSESAAPASDEVTNQTPAATNSTEPAPTTSLPPNGSDTTATPQTTPETSVMPGTMDTPPMRSAPIEHKSAPPTQPIQRTKPANKPSTTQPSAKSPSNSIPPTSSNPVTAPEPTTTAPASATQPAASEQTTTPDQTPVFVPPSAPLETAPTTTDSPGG